MTICLPHPDKHPDYLPTQTSTSTSAPELAILPALDVAMLGLTANIGKLVTLLVSVGVLVLVM